MKKCPYCDENNHDDAVKCWFCAKSLNSQDTLKDKDKFGTELLIPPEEEEALAAGYKLSKAKKFGWAWIIIFFGHSQIMKPRSWVNRVENPISIILLWLGLYLFIFLFYFWLRWKIIKYLVKRGTYEEKKWVPPTIGIFTCYILTWVILFLMAIFG